MCRSRRELSNAYFLAKFGFDAAENEPCQVSLIEQCSRRLLDDNATRDELLALCRGLDVRDLLDIFEAMSEGLEPKLDLTPS